jgi:membrane protein YdbS with pleckstrin-like domain
MKNIEWKIMGKATLQILGLVAVAVGIGLAITAVATYFSAMGTLALFVGILIVFLIHSQYKILKSRHEFDKKWGKK